MATIDPNRLFTQLLNTGLQTKDNPTYQVIYYLIDAIRELNKQLATANLGSGSGTGGLIVSGMGPPGSIGEDGLDGDAGPPGLSVPGSQGATGSVGPPGQGVYFIEDGIDGNDGFNIPNPGPQGATGDTGAIGPAVLLIESGIDGEDGIPGANGVIGVDGESSDLFPRKTYQSRATAENAVEPFSDWYNGTDVTTLAGTQSQPGADASGTWLRSTSTTTVNTSAGLRWHTGTTTQELTAGFALPRVRFKIRTGASVLNIRILIGLRVAAATPTADTETNWAMIRYSTNVPDGGFVGVTVDAAGNVNTTATILAIAANTIYEIEIEYISATEVKFTVNAATQTITHASQIPTANITPHCTVTTLLAGASKVIDFSIMSLDGL